MEIAQKTGNLAISCEAFTSFFTDIVLPLCHDLPTSIDTYANWRSLVDLWIRSLTASAGSQADVDSILHAVKLTP